MNNTTDTTLFNPSEPAPAGTVHGGTSELSTATGSEGHVPPTAAENAASPSPLLEGKVGMGRPSKEEKQEQAETRRNTRAWDDFLFRMREKGALIENE